MASAKLLTDIMLCVHRMDAEMLLRINTERQCPGVQVCCVVRVGEVSPSREPPSPGPTESPPPGPTQSPPPGSCGVRGGSLNPTWVRVLTEDKFTQFGEFPWMLALLSEEEMEGEDTQGNPFRCGASLIHPQVAVTAAHCVSRYLVHLLPTFISLFISVCLLNDCTSI